jgi:hypothetical protein
VLLCGAPYERTRQAAVGLDGERPTTVRVMIFMRLKSTTLEGALISELA